MRALAPKEAKGSGGFKLGIPVTAWISSSSSECFLHAKSASNRPETVPQTTPTPLSHAAAYISGANCPKN